MYHHWVLLPGLGADAELFFPQQAHFGDRLTVIDDADLPTASLEQAATTVAERLDGLFESGQLFKSGQFDDRQRLVLGGMSFGGSLALEVASRMKHRPVRIALIASNQTAASISTGFRVQRHIGSRLPTGLIRQSLGAAAKFFAWREGLDRKAASRLAAMAGRANIPTLLDGAAAIARWRRTEADNADLGIPIVHLHGRHDWVIPLVPTHATETLEDGKHLITWTHAEAVNDFLERAAQTK